MNTCTQLSTIPSWSLDYDFYSIDMTQILELLTRQELLRFVLGFYSSKNFRDTIPFKSLMISEFT